MRGLVINRKTVAIIGLGQIGGSLSLAFKQRKIFSEIRGYDQDKVLLRTAVKRGLIDSASENLKNIIPGADIIILAIPVREVIKILPELADDLEPQTVLGETGSTKIEILRLARQLGITNFVGLHPIAGSEREGMAGWNPGLFRNRIVTLTASAGCPRSKVELIKSVVSRIGAKPVLISAKKHDQILSATSHLPYLLSVALVNLVLGSNSSLESKRLVGGAFRDGTRVAMSSPSVMCDILYSNQKYVARQISVLVSLLKKYQGCLEKGDERRLLHDIVRARSLRNQAKVAWTG